MDNSINHLSRSIARTSSKLNRTLQKGQIEARNVSRDVKRELQPLIEKMQQCAGKLISEAGKQMMNGIVTSIRLKWKAVSFAKRLTNYDNLQFKDYFNYSWKSPVTEGSLAKQEAKMARRYQGNTWHRVFIRNFASAVMFERSTPHSEKEKKEIATLVAHRRIFVENSYLIEKGHTDEAVAAIQKSCDALSNAKSPNVVHVQSEKDAYTSFSFTGGSRDHRVTFECQRDLGGRYFFVIHNRGGGVADKQIHGDFFVVMPDNIYGKTSVRIEVSLEQLKDPEFLKALVRAPLKAPDMKTSYEIIKKHLLKPDASNIMVSVVEKAMIKTVAEIEGLIKKIEEVEKRDPQNPSLDRLKEEANGLVDELRSLTMKEPAFHSLQAFGTCTESNLTGPEKAMAGPQIRRELKLFTINQLAQEVSQSRVIWLNQIPDRSRLLKHHQFRKQQILEKISQHRLSHPNSE